MTNSHPLYTKCKDYDPTKHDCKWYQLKLDGHWACIENSPNGVSITTRRPTDITAKLRWHECYGLGHRMPVGCAVLGEIWLPGHPSWDIKTAINEKNSNLRFTAFAVARGLSPETSLPDVMLWCHAQGFETSVVYDEPPFGFGDMPPDVEGYVGKDGNLIGWRKWKPVRTMELIVKGRTPGEGKHAGRIGALVCKTFCGCEVAKVSGMTDEHRKEITEMFSNDTLNGRVVEVAYQEVTSKGRLRFPRFRCFRPDKAPELCTLNQDSQLLEYWNR